MGHNPNKSYEDRKIDRIDIPGRMSHHKGTHGYQVRFQSPTNKSVDINRFFNDSKYGGKEKSYEAAKNFRDAMEIERAKNASSNIDTMQTSRNKSGLVGVHKTQYVCKKKYGTYVYDVWQANYPIGNNKNKCKRFSIHKYGDEGAKKLALIWREEGLNKYKLNKDLDNNLFKPPEDISIKIWRYLDFTKFVSLLVNGGLYFSRSDHFDDQFEGSFSLANKKLRPIIYESLKRNYKSEDFSAFIKQLRKYIYINCWHLNEFESAGMWSLYSKTNEAICIQSTYKNFREILDKEINIGFVRYVDYEKEWIPEKNILSPFLYKRKSFEHEREIRAIINKSNINNLKNIKLPQVETEEGIWIKLNLKKFIQNVYVSPNSSNWFYELVSSVVSVYKLNVPVLRSSLEDEPFY